MHLERRELANLPVEQSLCLLLRAPPAILPKEIIIHYGDEILDQERHLPACLFVLFVYSLL